MPGERFFGDFAAAVRARVDGAISLAHLKLPEL